MIADKFDDALLHLLKIIKGLRSAKHEPVYTNGMKRHSGGGNYKGALGRRGKRYADGMSAAKNQGDRGLFHRGEHLVQSETLLHVTAHSIEYY